MEGQKSSIHQNREYEHEPFQNFKFVKNLKGTQQQCQMLRNRIKILQLNDHHKNKLLQNNLNKIEKLQQVRNQTHKNQGEIGQLKKKKIQNVQQKNKRNKKFKQTGNANYKANIQNIALKRAEIYDNISKQSKVNEKRIEEFKNHSLEQRKMKHEAVVLAQSRSKQKIVDYEIKKTKTIHTQQAKQNMLLAKKRDKKLQQIQNLQKTQLQMVKKYSESHYAFKNVQNKLDQMLGKFQNQKNVSNKKINNKEQNYERSQSFYVLNKNKS